MNNHSAHRPRGKPLGTLALIAIALGGMIGSLTPIAIIIGGAIASLAAYSYVKLAVYYKDEGATDSFFKLTFPGHPFAASLIGWFIIFGYTPWRLRFRLLVCVIFISWQGEMTSNSGTIARNFNAVME
ncbi:MAG: hypothetical protein COB33_000540 [Thiotrichaceae bacterium]|nr:hypothetical protein [Thiotrichaceae bacterium]